MKKIIIQFKEEYKSLSYHWKGFYLTIFLFASITFFMFLIKIISEFYFKH